MSATLLERVSDHIITDGGLLGGYALRYYKWTDAELEGSASIALFRNTGTAGASDSITQMPDVSLFLLVSPTAVQQGDADMLAVLRYLRSSYQTADKGIFNLFPLGKYTGPNYLQNNRAIFEMVIRCGVTDH